MIRLRQSGVDEILIKRVRDWYDPGPGCFFSGVTGVASFDPASLFTTGVNGVWYDPSDFSTLFQDAAGTTPVTAVEQPVGKMLDKSGNGNHAFNSSGNSANFPVLSAKYNLLTKTEQFDDAVTWSRAGILPFGSGSVANTSATTDPLGGNTADFICESTLSDRHIIYTGTITTVASGTEELLRISAKYGGRRYLTISHHQDSPSYVEFAFFDLVDGVVTSSVGITATASKNPTTGWVDCTFRRTRTGTAGAVVIGLSDRPGPTGTLSFGSPVYTGDGISGIYIWGADLRVANDALNQPAYQRVNTSSDYDTVGFKQGEVFDGINDYLTASAGGGSTTSFFWCSAIRAGKVGAVQTLFSDAGTNTGYRVRINASNQLELSAGNGTAYTTVSTTATLSIGQRAVLTAWHDGANLNVQINSGTVHQSAFSTATAGTAQCTIGKDNNAASNFFAGWLYEKVYTKDNVPSSSQIADTKAYVANIAGITL